MNVKKRKKLLMLFVIMMCCLPMLGLKAEAKKIYTGNTKVDCAAEKIIQSCTKPGMSRRQKLKRVYLYLVKHMKYTRSRGPVRVKVTKKEMKAFRKETAALRAAGKVRYSSKFSTIYDNLLTLRGKCKDMSGAFCILANHLGYRAGYTTGRYVRSNGISSPHWWNYVIVDGKKYYCDVQAANCSWEKHHSVKAVEKYYLKTKNSRAWRAHHR